MSFLTVTDDAKNYFLKVMKEHSKNNVLIKVTMRGCNGLTPSIDFTEDNSVLSNNSKINLQDDYNLIIDKSAEMFLIGATIGWKTDKLSSHLTWDIPMSTGTCGCGESFSV